MIVLTHLIVYTTLSILFWRVYKLFWFGFYLNFILLVWGLLLLWVFPWPGFRFTQTLLGVFVPLVFFNFCLLLLADRLKPISSKIKFKVKFLIKNGSLSLENIRRGVSIIGSAGSGKTESIILNLLQHLSKHQFYGIIHDYKDFELTEIAFPLFQKAKIPFYTVSFDPIHHRVNPIAPKYLPNEESVNEISKVLIENLLEIKDSNAVGNSKFFNDAVEGLVGGLIWKLKNDYPEFCTLPHLIALYNFLGTDDLVAFLCSNQTAKSMASAFINGIDSERQTAAVKSTLSNALKKISTQRIFMTLSADEIPLDINNPEKPGVIALVNNPKFESAYAPIIATLMHAVVKQMSIRQREPSFILMEEAPTLRLLNMHRIPATLRSFDISTIYVMQDKIQNDLLYGDKASKAILSNLSYQFFGKVNDPDTAKYYEQFFEIVKKKTISINKGFNLNFDTRVTHGEKEVSKIRADVFFRLKPGEFVSFMDGKDRKIQFKLQKIAKFRPRPSEVYSEKDLKDNFQKIQWEVQSMFKKSL